MSELATISQQRRIMPHGASSPQCLLINAKDLRLLLGWTHGRNLPISDNSTMIHFSQRIA
jgi:hypothetical protein